LSTHRWGLARSIALLAFVGVGGVADADARPLRWAVDPTGGAPYAFADPLAPETLIGFEVELVERLAAATSARLHEPVPVIVVRGDYARLAGLVERGDADLALNGLEERAVAALGARATTPYFDAPEVWTLRDASAAPDATMLRGLKVGTLPSTYAEAVLRERGADVKSYDGGQGEIFDDLLRGRTEAALIDEPVARYYGAVRTGLHLAPSTFGGTRYVGVVHANDAFGAEIGEALRVVLASGDAATIYARWGLLNAQTRALCTVPATLPESTELARWDAAHRGDVAKAGHAQLIVRATPILLRALGTTMAVSALAMVGAVALGAVLAFAMLFGGRPLRLAARVYVEAFRGTPLFMQLTLIYFGLPQVGITLAPFAAGTLGLALNYAASEAENFRAGFLGVPTGLLDAGRVLGLSQRESLRHVVAPLALRGALPPMTNDFLALLKDSALVSVVTVTELTRAYMTLATTTGAFLEMGLVIAAIYLVAGFPFVLVARRLEGSFRRRMRTMGEPS
jgi:polar amino acid transport system substrate-binding protein